MRKTEAKLRVVFLAALLCMAFLLVPAGAEETERDPLQAEAEETERDPSLTDQGGTIGIISAMDNEIALLLENARVDHVDHIGGRDFHVGELCGRHVVIVKAGIGKVLSAAGTATLINMYRPSQVIFTGIAGGVGDETEVLDVVIATDLVQHDYGKITNDGFVWKGEYEDENVYCSCDPGMISLAYDCAVRVVGEDHVFKGTIATGDQFVASEEYVKLLQEKFDAIACEMEGASIAAVCAEYDVPCVVIRSMSDKADGYAQSSIENMGDIAADNSSSIVMEMLKSESAGMSQQEQYIEPALKAG